MTGENINGPKNCRLCGGEYDHGSGLYAYYRCWHAYEKPLLSEKTGKWVWYRSPYYPNIYKRDVGHER